MPLMLDMRFSLRSIVFANAAFPASHSFIRTCKSMPMLSYWTIKCAPKSEMSSDSSSALSDSSRRTCILACKERIPVDRVPNLRSCPRQRSRPGVSGTLGVAGIGNADKVSFLQPQVSGFVTTYILPVPAQTASVTLPPQSPHSISSSRPKPSSTS